MHSGQGCRIGTLIAAVHVAGAKARAEQEFASARTQQEAERAEQAIKDTAAALKDVMRLKVSLVHLHIFPA